MAAQGMTRGRNDDACPTVKALEVVGEQWRLHVLYALRNGELRFNELKRETGASSRTLSGALDALQEHGLVERRSEPDAPIAVYYSLSESGEALAPVFEDVEAWAEEWLEA
ncbi:MAG: winged helix-turn-helix transcriptional regulator [Halobacteriaceae archaeon]